MAEQLAGRPHPKVEPRAKAPLLPPVNFSTPAGAPAYYAPDSPAWDIFKNPIALYIGGIAAVLLELGEPRVRTGVWGHSIFPDQPLTRLKRTGAIAHITVYASQNLTQQTIAAVNRMHTKVRGTTPEGYAYDAADPQLLDWVQCTVGYGFMEAYHRYCRRLSAQDRDRSYADAQPIAALFGAHGAPTSVAEQQAQFDAMRPYIAAHPILSDFIEIMRTTPSLPFPLRRLQWMMIRAAINLLPKWAVTQLELDGARYRLKPWEARLIRGFGWLFERLPVPGTPPFQAAKRLGLKGSYLYWGRRR